MPKPSTPAVWASGKSFAFQPSAAQQAQGFDYIASARPGTGAPITDDHDWPLNQITSALKWILDSGLGYGAAMIGVPIPWPLQKMPQDIWPEIGMTFLAMTGQSFSSATYPSLALAYPSLVVPDMRIYVIRGWNNGVGLDPTRTLLSTQANQNKSHTHVPSVSDTFPGSGTIPYNPANTANGVFLRKTGDNYVDSSFSASSEGGNEARMDNIAFNYIVRAA